MKYLLEALLVLGFGLFVVFTAPASSEWQARLRLRELRMKARWGHSRDRAKDDEADIQCTRRRVLISQRVFGLALTLLALALVIDALLRL